MKKKIEHFEDIEIWQKAAAIAIDIFKLCDEQPKLKYDWGGTRDQIQRAAFSISNNIAEGFEYNNNKDFVRFLRYAKGSTGEVRSKLYILKETKRVPETFYKDKAIRIRQTNRRLHQIFKKLQRIIHNPQSLIRNS